MSVDTTCQSRTFDEVQTMHWRCTFCGSPDQVAAARRFIAALVANSPLRNDAVLVISELATNAVRHTRSGRPGGHFIVTLVHRPTVVTVAVTDQGGPTTPTMAPNLDALAISWRGIPTVASLASDCGWHGDKLGRTVWAELIARPQDDEPQCAGCF